MGINNSLMDIRDSLMDIRKGSNTAQSSTNQEGRGLFVQLVTGLGDTIRRGVRNAVPATAQGKPRIEDMKTSQFDGHDEEEIEKRVSEVLKILGQEGEPAAKYLRLRDGKEIYVEVSRHAIQRFQERIGRLYRIELGNSESLKLIRYFFNRSKREALNTTAKLRKKEYTPDSMYFKNGCFRFVVSEKVIVTFELRGNAREFNQRY